MIKRNLHNRGLVKAIILIVVVLLVISYFGFNLREIVNSETFQNNWEFIKEAIVWLWDNIFKAPIEFIWNSILLPLFKKLIG